MFNDFYHTGAEKFCEDRLRGSAARIGLLFWVQWIGMHAN